MSTRSRRGAKRKADADADSGDVDSSTSSASSDSASSQMASSTLFQGLEFVYGSKLDGYTATAFASLIKEHGGTVNSSRSLPDSVNYVVAKSETAKVKDAVAKNINVVNEEWLNQSISQKKLMDDDKYFTHKKSAATSSASSASASQSVDANTNGDPGDDGDDENDAGRKKKKARKASASKAKSKGKSKKTATSTADDGDAEDEADDGDGDDDNKSAAPKSEPQLKTVLGHSASSGTKNLIIPVNEHFPIGNVHVYVDPSDGTIWDALLNQVDISNNNNKYYCCQLLQSNDGNQFYTWTAWGRVGALAGSANSPCGGNVEAAKKIFKAKFKDKTKNDWDNRDNFSPVKGKYTLLERDYSADPDAMDEDSPANGGEKKKEEKPSELDPRVQDFVRLISNQDIWKAQMIEIGYDAKKLPLGKLSAKTVKQGYEALQRLATAISEGKKHACIELSNQFYTLIPHATRLSVRPPVIDNPKLLKEKLELVESLSDIEVANKVLGGSGKNDVDEAYERLHCELTPVDKKSAQYKMVEHYFTNTHAPTHSYYKLRVLDVFEVNRDAEAERFKSMEHVGNRQLLFHGSRLTNFVGILSQGLRIAPPEAPATGYMFGKGIYLADSMSKSANYCYASSSTPTGVMLLCEAALGDMNLKYSADYNAANLPSGKWSTKGVGQNAPNPSETITIDDGKVSVPTGKIIHQTLPAGHSASLLYNEYIVYNIAQVKIRYAVKVQFEYGR